MKNLIIAVLLTTSMAVSADSNKDIQRLVSLTSEISDLCIELIPTHTVQNKACKQLLKNMGTLKKVDTNDLLKALQSYESNQQLNNIIKNARSLKIVYQSKSY